MAEWVCFGTLFFTLIRWIQFCDKKKIIWHSLTAVIKFYYTLLKNIIKLVKGSLNNIFKDSFNKILSQQ